MRRADPLTRFERFYIPEPNSGCWLWIGHLSKDGYGKFLVSQEKRGTLAHRFSYENSKGPIPLGLVLDHKCRTRSCVNPDHLEPVTHLENLRRSPLLDGSKMSCRKGHLYTPENTRHLKNGKRFCVACYRKSNMLRAREYRARKRNNARP